MKTILEHDDIAAAVAMYVKTVLNLEAGPGGMTVIVTSKGRQLSAVVTGGVPRKDVPAPAVSPDPVMTSPAPSPPDSTPLARAIQEQHTDWNNTARNGTDLAALGKLDGGDFADEITGDAQSVSSRVRGGRG